MEQRRLFLVVAGIGLALAGIVLAAPQLASRALHDAPLASSARPEPPLPLPVCVDASVGAPILGDMELPAIACAARVERAPAAQPAHGAPRSLPAPDRDPPTPPTPRDPAGPRSSPGSGAATAPSPAKSASTSPGPRADPPSPAERADGSEDAPAEDRGAAGDDLSDEPSSSEAQAGSSSDPRVERRQPASEPPPASTPPRDESGDDELAAGPRAVDPDAGGKIEGGPAPPRPPSPSGPPPAVETQRRDGATDRNVPTRLDAQDGSVAIWQHLVETAWETARSDWRDFLESLQIRSDDEPADAPGGGPSDSPEAATGAARGASTAPPGPGAPPAPPPPGAASRETSRADGSDPRAVADERAQARPWTNADPPQWSGGSGAIREREDAPCESPCPSSRTQESDARAVDGARGADGGPSARAASSDRAPSAAAPVAPAPLLVQLVEALRGWLLA